MESKIFRYFRAYFITFITKDTVLVMSAIIIIGRKPIRVTHGTSSSVTFTMIADITNEKSQSVIRRSGNDIIRKSVPRKRFTSPRITANIRALTYPFIRVIPSMR